MVLAPTTALSQCAACSAGGAYPRRPLEAPAPGGLPLAAVHSAVMACRALACGAVRHRI